MTAKRSDGIDPRVVVAAAVLLMAGVVAGDIAYGARVVLIVGVTVGPMLAVVAGVPRVVAALAAASLLLAVISPVWNENFGELDWVLRTLAVALGCAAAIITAQARAREARQLRRMRLLADLGDVATGEGTVEQVAQRIARVLAPGLADAAAVDVSRGEVPQRLAVAGDGALLQPQPQTPAHVVTVPLETRGGTRGALTLATAPGGLGQDELEFARIAAGRAALALDNAGLSSELDIVERQLAAALTNLAEAVTVQRADGSLVYANQAAADALGFASPADVVAQRPQAIVDSYEPAHPDGRPVTVDEFPGRRVLAGEDPEPLLLRMRDRITREERWRIVKATAVRDDEGKVLYAVNVIEDVTEVKRAELTQRLLAEASRTLAASLDPDETLQRVAEVGVPDLAEWCTVHLPDDSGIFVLAGVAHEDPQQVQRAREVGARFPGRVDEPGGMAEVLRTGRAQLLPDIPPEAIDAAARGPEHAQALREIGIRSAMLVPMEAGGRTVGVLTFVNTDARRPFDEGDLKIALDLGRRAGSAAENARLYAEQARIAETLQQDLKPPDLPDLPGWTSAAWYSPAGEGSDVGGDFYDAFEVDDGWVVVLGDVAGRGPAAASLTAMARYTLRTAATLSNSLATAVALLNRELYERPRMALCSICLVQLHGGEREGEVSLVAAGHPDPYVIRDGEARSAAVGGPLLGALTRGDWPVVRLRLDPGDAIVVYTDGVIDTEGAEERFGEQRLLETLQQSGGADDAVARIRRALEAFASGRHRDDTAVLALQRGGERGPGTAENRHRARLASDASAPGIARRAVVDWLSAILPPERLDEVRLLVSELVTNGVLHGTRRAGDALDLDVRITNAHVRVEVYNPGPSFVPGPERKVPATDRGGRGLLLVRRIADRWGVEPGDRTCVWFEIAR